MTTTAGSTSTSTSGESDVGGTTQPVLDLGITPDLGDGNPVGCKGKIAEDWATAVLDAKDDPASVVLLYIGNPAWEEYDDQILEMLTMFPYGLVAHWASDYGAAFETASGLVETACAGFAAPG